MALAGWPDDIDDDGTGQTGTIHNKAFSDAEEAAIEAYVVSGTNPTVTPADIIDEVIDAREGEPTLKDRIDAVEAEIGVGSVSEATVEEFLGSGNVVRNGDFFDWETSGSNDQPVGWVESGTGIAVTKTGIAQVDTFHFGTGSGFAAKVARGVTAAKLTQQLIATSDFAKFSNIKSQKVSVTVKCKSSVPSQARIVVDDGITTTASSYHTGGGTEEHLSVTHTISSSATKIDINLAVDAIGGGAYFGGVQVIFSPLAPTDWQPMSAPVLASDLQRGVVGLEAQIMGRGIKAFTRPPTFAPGNVDPTGGGGFTDDAVVVGSISNQYADVGNTGAGPDPLMSFTLNGAAFEANGRGLRITGWGSFANNANAKRIQFDFGPATLNITKSAVFTSEDWIIEIRVLRESNTAIRFCVRTTIGTTTGITAGEQETVASGAAGFDFANNNYTWQFTATGTAANDVIQKGMMVEVVG